MLIMSRRGSETVQIGEEATVAVLGVERNQIRFATDAPRHVAVNRHEVAQRIATRKGNAR